MLEPYLKPVLSKHRGVALGVWGEAGIGKSYYTTQLLKNLPCATLSVHSKVNLSTFAAQLPKSKKLPLWASKTLEKVQQGESVEGANFISALGASLTGLAPFVLHLEDIHEADPERLAIFTDLAQSIKKLKGVGLLVSSRQLPSEPFMAVKLESLTKEASDKLLEQELSSTLPKEGLEFIYSKAAGNPLFTLEYLRFLTRQGNLWNDGKSWHWRNPEQNRMPVVVEALVEEMIGHARRVPMQAYVLEAKALLPLDAPDELWQKVARVEAGELKIVQNDLTKQGVFKNDSFAHPLFKEVTLKTLSVERKQHLSRRAINVLQDDLVQAAGFVDDAKLGNDEALELLKQAAESVKESNKNLAGKLFVKAIDYAAEEEKGALALRAATVLQGYDIDEAFSLVQYSLTTQPDNAEAVHLGAFLLSLQFKQEDAEAMIARLSPQDLLTPRGLEARAMMHVQFGQMAKVVELWEEQVKLKTKLTIKFIVYVVYALDGQSRSKEAVELARYHLERPDLTPLDKLGLWASLGTAHKGNLEFERSEEALQKATEIAHQADFNNVRLAALLHNLAFAQRDLLKFQEAEQSALKLLQVVMDLGDDIHVSRTYLLLSSTLLELGEYQQAEHYLTEARSMLGSNFLIFDATITTSQLYRNWSQINHGKILAVRYGYLALQQARTLNRTDVVQEALHHLILAEIGSGNPQTALELVKELEEYALEDSMKNPFNTYCVPWDKGLALELLGKKEKAKNLLAEAYQLAIGINNHLYAYKIALELDRLNNDVESARKRMQWFEERGLMNGVNIAKRYFPELAAADILPTAVMSEELPRLEVLGVMQLRQNNKPQSIKGSKRQEFLALLLEAKLSGRAEVGRLELLDLLYPGQDELKASNNVRDLVSTLRERMGASAILTTASGYALGNVTNDAEQFLKTGDTSLWRGLYLQGLGIEGQETVSESLYLTLFEKTKELLEANPKETARVTKMLLEVDPYNREYLMLCLQAFRATNNHKSLNRLYAEAKGKFIEVGETLPQTWQMFLESSLQVAGQPQRITV